MTIVVRVENLSKHYRLGVIGSGTLSDDLSTWWARVRGQPDPRQRPIPGPGGSAEQSDLWALRDVSFDVQEGEILGIIGRNGAGKSTLLKVLSRITAPTTGLVKLKGRIASLLEVGTGFHPELTGRENIYLNGVILGMKKVEIARKLDAIIAFSEIQPFIDTPVKRYSSGMYVRLAFAVAAHLEPEILIVDEVLAVGDAQFQKKCLGKMGDIVSEGRTILFVSHNMPAIRHLCGRAILLRAGQLVADGEPSLAIAAYLQELASQEAETPDDLIALIRNLPVDPCFRLDAITLTQDQRPVAGFVENGKPLELQLAYRVFERTSGLRVFFDLYDDQENLLFRSFNDEANDGIPIVNPGAFCSTAIIPANLLAPRSYILRISATIFNVRNFFPEPLSLKLNVVRTGTANRAYLAEPIRGKLAPSLHWETSKL